MSNLKQFEKSNINRNIQSDDQSSSLKFLGSEKQEDNDDVDEENKIVAKKRPRDWEDNQRDKTQNQNRKKQKPYQEFTNNAQTTFLYKPGVEFPNLFNLTNQTIKVIIAAQYVTRTNPSVLKRKIYGTDTYSSNSDCVCIGIHFGLFNFNSFLNKKFEGVQITFKVIKPKKNYNGSHKNGIISQTIKNYAGNALKPESSKMLLTLGSLQNLQKYAANMRIVIGKTRKRQKPIRISNILPLPETNFIFNIHNQLAFKFTIYNIADKGFDKNQFLFRKLDSKALYFETKNKQKYELSKYIQKTYFQAFKFAKVKNPIRFDNQYFAQNAAPLQNQDLEMLQPLVEWDEIVFGQNWIKINKTIVEDVISFKFYPICSK